MNRSQKLKKNIIISIGLTGLNLLVSFLMYPLLIDLLGVSVYGTWLTISSVATWMTFFEFGLGSGLKNQLGVSIANSRYSEGKELVSTTYFVIGCIVAFLFLVFFLFRNAIDWGKLLNSSIDNNELESFVSVMASCYFIVFFLKLLGNVASANQEPFIEKIISSSVQLGSFMVVIVLTYLHIRSIFTLSVYWTLATISIWVIFSVILYSKRYNRISPSFRAIRSHRFKTLTNLGLKFFIIQLCLIIITGSTNFLISRYISSDEVVTYNATYKVFSVAQILYSIIVAPTWPAFVDAIEKKDYCWIRRIVKKMILLWSAITGGMALVLICSPFIYRLWLGERVTIPFLLSVLLFVYFSTMTFGGIFNMYVNATGKLKIQIISWLLAAVFYIPFVIFLIQKCNFGIYAIAVGLLCTNIYYIAIAPLQYHNSIKEVNNE